MRDPLIGTRIDRYEIRESIHKSDVIGIYKAYDTKLERFVLIKTIIHSSEYSKEAVDFFLAESRSLAKLAHPNIAKVLDFGYENGNLYLVSEFVPGVLLSDLMNNPMPWQNAINILLPLTSALIYAHSRGIIHRDLKPGNIIINNDDQPILSDFSLMRIIEEEETRDMTGTNVGLGSPEYISPEQGQGLSVDFRSDIYSLGVIFFEMVTGKKLFYATSSMEIVIQHIMADPPKPRSIIPTLPKMVETVILNALSKDRERRYQSMEEFSNALKAVIEAANREKNKTTRRPSRLMLVSIIGVSLLLISIVFLIRSQTSTATPLTLTAANGLSTQTPRLTSTPTPDSAPPASPTLREPTVLLQGPFATYQLPALPVLAGTKLPASEVLTVNNIGAIQELARWEKPAIRQLALINDDQVILAATSAGIYFYDPKDLSAQLFFDTQGALVAFAVSDDGEFVATADENGIISIWSIVEGKKVNQLQDKNYTAKTIKSLDFSPDHSKLVFSDNASNIHFWNIDQDQYYPFENRLGANANKVMFLDAGATVISGGDEHQIMIWDVATSKLIEQYPTSQKINDMSLSSDHRYLALALNEATIEIWDLFAKQKIHTIADPRLLGTPFNFITFLPNESTILTGSEDGFVRTWSVSGSTPLLEITSANQSDHPEAVNAVKSVSVTKSGSKSGSKFVVEFANGLIEIWDTTLSSQLRVTTKELGTTPIKRLAISPDDQLLALQHNDQLLALQGNDPYVEVLALADDSQKIKISGTLPRGNPISPDSAMISIVPNDNLKLLNLYTLASPLPTTTPEPQFKLYDFPVFGSVSYSADGNMLTAFAGSIFNYWSTSSGRELKESLPKRARLCHTIYRRNGSFIAAGSENGVISLDANLNYFCQIPRNPRVTSEKFMLDGSIIALALQNQRLEIWDARNGDQKQEITIQTSGDVLDVAISKDGQLLAAASEGGAIEIYNLETLGSIKTLEVLTGPVNQVIFTNDGKYLIAGTDDGTLRIFGLHP